MENALWVSGGAGGIDGVCGVMIARVLMAAKRLAPHDVIPVLHGDFHFAAAVLTDIVDPLRGIGVLYQRPGRSRLPHADHGNHRQHTARKIDQNEVLFSDFVRFQPGIDASRQIIQLGIGDTLCMRIVKEDRCTGVHLGIMLQSFNYCFHSAVSLLMK